MKLNMVVSRVRWHVGLINNQDLTIVYFYLSKSGIFYRCTHNKLQFPIYMYDPCLTTHLVQNTKNLAETVLELTNLSIEVVEANEAFLYQDLKMGILVKESQNSVIAIDDSMTIMNRYPHNKPPKPLLERQYAIMPMFTTNIMGYTDSFQSIMLNMVECSLYSMLHILQQAQRCGSIGEDLNEILQFVTELKRDSRSVRPSNYKGFEQILGQVYYCIGQAERSPSTNIEFIVAKYIR